MAIFRVIYLYLIAPLKAGMSGRRQRQTFSVHLNALVKT